MRGIVVAVALWCISTSVLAADAPKYRQAIVILNEQADITALKARFALDKIRVRERHRLVVEELKRVADASQPQLLAKIEAAMLNGEVETYTPLHVINAIVVKATSDAIAEITAMPEVRAVEPDYEIEILDDLAPSGDSNDQPPLDAVAPGLNAIRAPLAWAAGYTGAGVLVGHLDSGVHGNHPALVNCWRGNYGFPYQHCWLDLMGTTTFPSDATGHGTQTLGIVCGMIPNDTVGVAWGARYIAARLNSSQMISTALLAFQWMLDPDGNPNTFEDVPRVVTNSWGLEAAAFGACYAEFNSAIDNCEAAGIAVFWAAGNEGTSGDRTIRTPADRAVSATSSFAVGAINSATDIIWPSSSRGPSTCSQNPQWQFKPELVAPGVSVRTTSGTNSFTNSATGTSFSCPHVAGVAALVTEVNPELSTDSIKNILLLTAVDKGLLGEDNTYGRGLVDAYAAILGAMGGIGWVAGRITDPYGFGVPALISFFEHPHRFQTDADGNFCFPMPAQTWLTMLLDVPSFVPQTQSMVLNAGDTLALDITLALAGDGGVLTGVVTSCLGWPAVGAVVSVSDVFVPNVLTDAQGRFHLILHAGLHDVSAEDGYCSPGMVPGVQVVAGGLTDIEIVLPPNPQHLCSPRDVYGYRVCDDFDPGGPDTGWVEIAPSLGGKGVVHNLGDDGSIGVLLPFPVRFYGIEHRHFFINSNGNISFGRGYTGYWNTAMPRLVVPALYAFWDNFRDNYGGDICSWHDAAQGTFVVEWNEVPTYPEEGVQTFQILIHDPAVLRTSGGNSVMDVRYRDISVTNSCTIGLDANDGVNYLQYLYNGVYPEHASLLLDGRALRFHAGNLLSGAPHLRFPDPALYVSVPMGTEIDTSIQIQNLGDAPAAYAVSLGAPLWTRFDTLTSRMVGGPQFQFTDISTYGQNVGLVRDDTTSDPVSLPWDFPFFGRYFNQLGICSNGYVTFTSCRSDAFGAQNWPLTDQRDPYYMLAPYWTDLNPANGGAVYAHYDSTGRRFIVQWHQIRKVGQSSPNTFEAILYYNGMIEFSYASMAPLPLGNYTAGLKGGNSSEVFSLAYNRDFIQNNLMIRFNRSDTARVICEVADGAFGVINPGEIARVLLRLKNRTLFFGEVPWSLTVLSSDSARPSLTATVTLQSAPAYADIRLTAAPVAQGIRLNWNRAAAPCYCVYSGAVGDTVMTHFEVAVTDTFVTLPYTVSNLRFFQVRLCTGNP